MEAVLCKAKHGRIADQERDQVFHDRSGWDAEANLPHDRSADAGQTHPIER